MTAPGSSATTGATTPTTIARTTTVSTAPSDFGESERPITVPPTTVAALDPSAPVAEAAARAFLDRFWAPGARTSAQLADSLAPFATDQLLAGYRDPARADRAVTGAGIGEIGTQVTAATPTTAVVVGRGTMVDEPDRRVVYRTLDLVLAPDGTWRVAVVR